MIGLCVAYYARKKGHEVHIVEREGEDLNGCSFGNAGFVVPSHFIPLAAPGMVAKGLKWMWNPESPFYVKPRFSAELLRWGWKFSGNRGKSLPPTGAIGLLSSFGPRVSDGELGPIAEVSCRSFSAMRCKRR